MSYLTVEGVPVPVLDQAGAQHIEIGMRSQAQDGTPRRYLRGGKRRLVLSTGPLGLADADALEALLEGLGDGWLFGDDDGWSAKGSTLVAGGLVWMPSAPGMPHGAGTQVPGTATWAPDVPGEWTLSYWRSADGTAAAQHVVGTSAGAWWVDGAPASNPGHIAISTGMTVGQGVYAYVRLLPAIVPASWPALLRAEDVLAAPQPAPRLRARSLSWSSPAVCMGRVEGSTWEAGKRRLSVVLEER